jgi:hypothetical protein
MTKFECLQKCREILDAHCEDPARALEESGLALMEIGKALKGQTPNDARAIIRSLQALEGA